VFSHFHLLLWDRPLGILLFFWCPWCPLLFSPLEFQDVYTHISPRERRKRRATKQNLSSTHYVYMCVYTYVYVYIYTYTYICIYMYVCLYIYMYICTYIDTYVYLYTYIYMYIYMYIYICIYTYMESSLIFLPAPPSPSSSLFSSLLCSTFFQNSSS